MASYLTDYLASPYAEHFGLTLGTKQLNPYSASFLFRNSFDRLPAADRLEGMQKTVVHEVGHQLLLPGPKSSGHRGTPTRGPTDVERYYRSSLERKREDTWYEGVNIMSGKALEVPMNNPNTALPGEPDALAGPINRFYFYDEDLVTIRKRFKSPGT